jgi:hypothetical protein
MPHAFSLQTIFLNPSRRLRLVRNLLLLSICVFALSSGLNSWLSYRLEKPPAVRNYRQEPGAPDKVPGRPGQTRGDTDLIIKQNIFGGSPYEPSRDEEKKTALKNIPLARDLKQFLLIGTIITSDAENIAIIENQRKREQQMYVKGDQIQGAAITRILRNNVIVNDGSNDKMLSIDYQIRKRLQQENQKAPQSSAPNRQPRTLAVEEKDSVQQPAADEQAPEGLQQ